MNLKTIIFIITPIILAAFIIWVKITHYGVAFQPEVNVKTWYVEAHIKVKGRNRSAKISLELPTNTKRYEIFSENFVSNGFAVAMLNSESGTGRRAQWSGFAKEQDYDFYYRAKVGLAKNADLPERVKDIHTSTLKPEDSETVKALLNRLTTQKLTPLVFVEDLVKEIIKGTSSLALDLRAKVDNDFKMANLMVNVLSEAGYQARGVSGLKLISADRASRFFPWVEVFIEGKWISIDVRKAKLLVPESWFSWRRSGEAFLITKGVDNAAVKVSVNPEESFLGRPSIPKSALDKFPSVQRLPIEAQALYRILLVMPVGALFIALIRSIVGIKTLGTFMPVLIALSFRETELIWGLALYLSIIILSLIARYLFDHLQLLVVPRLTATMTLVVMIIFLFSALMDYLDLNKALSVALFPIVILTMMIERISVIWEELGLWQASLQTTTSLAVASLVYLVISNSYVQYYMMVFPELLLVVLGIAILLGRFTGYRLVELYRFRSFLAKNSQQ